MEPIEGIYQGMSGVSAEGYEIHMGETCLLETCGRFASMTDCVTGKQYPDGCVKGNVCGTYIHGILDAPGLLKGLLNPVFLEKGMTPGTYRDLAGYRQEQYDILADVIRAHMDMDAVRRIIGLK